MRLHILVEGQSEESFAKKVLVPHLAGFGVFANVTTIITKRLSAGSHFRGGVTCWKQVMDSLSPLLLDSSAWVTTMFDFYGLPEDFPALSECRSISDPRQSVLALQQRFGEACGGNRFIPFFSFHEFETWIFSSPKMVSEYIGSPMIEKKMLAILSECQEPEYINHGPTTHPKARLLELYPRYRPKSDGPIILKTIGLQQIRQECPHFNSWISQLESLATPQP